MHPRRLTAAWNWKSALLSAALRAPIFFLVNLQAGLGAAVDALVTELAYRVVAAGFFGAMTEWFARLPPGRGSTLGALVVLPAIAHIVEYVVHTQAGTAIVGLAVLASVGVSVATTAVSLAVMRRGLFVVGHGRHSLADDVVALVRLIWRKNRRGPDQVS